LTAAAPGLEYQAGGRGVDDFSLARRDFSLYFKILSTAAGADDGFALRARSPIECLTW
jgi:hypothetical protein